MSFCYRKGVGGRGRRYRRVSRRRRHVPPRFCCRTNHFLQHDFSPLSVSSDTDSEDSSSEMPGGFENCAMKTSFSLSSLQPSSGNLESPEHARLQDRPYSSLRKKPRKDHDQESWRKSWGSREENKDEFWAALKNNYQYLMDSNLIESCKEARRDLQCGASPTHEWSFDQFTEQFTELDSWLSSIEEAVYRKEETVIDRKLRLSHMEEMQRKSYKRKFFNNQCGRIVARMPELQDEVAWRVSYLNSKWERIEQTVTPRKRTHPDHLDVCTDVEHELRCLRKWIKETEQRLKPLSFRVKWSLQELEEKAKEHEVVQKDVWSHGKVVCSVVKLCEKLAWAEEGGGASGGGVGEEEESVVLPQGGGANEGSGSGGGAGGEVGGVPGSVVSLVRGRRFEPSQAVRFARGLQRRWQLLYLASLEWQCHIERLTNDLKTQGSVNQNNTVLESDEEPVKKYPRLGDDCFEALSPTNQTFENDVLMETSETVPQFSDPQKMEVETVCSVEKVTYRDNSPGMEMEVTQEKVIISQTLSPNVARKLFLEESSKFDRTNRSAPNCATFYFKHSDTEEEGREVSSQGEGKGGLELEESSEEEWTYTGPGDQTTSCCEGTTSMSTSMQELTDSKTLASNEETSDQKEAVATANTAESVEEIERPRHEDIKRLVNKAEEMVREVATSPARKAARVFEPLCFTDPATKVKYTRVEEWLQLNRPDSKAVGDSCDASGEYTTEDDDIDGREKCVMDSQQDLDATLVPQAHTYIEPKVIMRVKKRDGISPRPWSVSGAVATSIEIEPLPHSISESAIHQIDQTTQRCGSKVDSSVNTVNTLSSSTMEDTGQTQDGSGGGYSSNSLRRRKVKLRKRNTGRKSESGSEGMSPVMPPDTLYLQTSGSPGKCLMNGKPSSRRSSADKVFADSPHRRYPTTVLSPTSSDSESEEESEDSVKLRRKSTVAPSFRLGPAHTVNVYASEKKEKLVSADSSYSEQAWDSYQEKYMSEAYSEEPADSETARKLLEFGDDYQKYLDSQSDCASSLGRPPPHRRWRPPAAHGNDSDSESEEVSIRHLVQQSSDRYTFSEKVLNTQLSKASPWLVLAQDFADLIATCKDNVKCLTTLITSIEQDITPLSEEERKELRALIGRWEGLEKEAEDLQRVRSLQREMSYLKSELFDVAAKVGGVDQEIQDGDQLDLRIQEVKSQVSHLRDLKTQLLQVNVAVHRFLTDSGYSSPKPLKDEVSELYRLWDETQQRVWSELNSLQEVRAAWSQFESHLQGLQSALKNDQETLRLLDLALSRGGSVSPDLASSVRDLAKVLSEKQDSTIIPQDDLSSGGGVNCGGTEGSLSDSGISDSGSEQDLSERERRLAALRRLVRHLEAVLAPGSIAIANMSKRIQATEDELRGLQQTCRDLIVRTAVCAESKRQLGTANGSVVSTPPTSSARKGKKQGSVAGGGVGGGGKSDPGKEREIGGGGRPTWLWRVMRAALPFQLAILALFCVACLLEPQCCDSMNNLNFSFSQQIRYVRGPPPV